MADALAPRGSIADPEFRKRRARHARASQATADYFIGKLESCELSESDVFRLSRLLSDQTSVVAKIISARDAAERAEACANVNEARTLLRSAERSGDEQLAAAIARWALYRHPELVDEYVAADPARREIMGVLQDLGPPLR